jgi:triosephosphate isomerase
MAKALLIGNWKMNKLRGEISQFAAGFRSQFSGSSAVGCMIAPSYLALDEAVRTCSASGLGVVAQNVHFEKSGAFTGEVSISMLAEIGVKAAIVGHSERRHFFGETDDGVAKKAKALTLENFLAVACVGESKDERQSNRTSEVIQRQISAILEAVADPTNLVIAYEPVWAIGTGLNATPEQAAEVHAQIRKMLNHRYGSAGNQVRILYGGSVKSSNIAGLYQQPNIDGALVGGASLDAKEFGAIAASIASASK